MAQANHCSESACPLTSHTFFFSLSLSSFCPTPTLHTELSPPPSILLSSPLISPLSLTLCLAPIHSLCPWKNCQTVHSYNSDMASFPCAVRMRQTLLWRLHHWQWGPGCGCGWLALPGDVIPLALSQLPTHSGPRGAERITLRW